MKLKTENKKILFIPENDEDILNIGKISQFVFPHEIKFISDSDKNNQLDYFKIEGNDLINTLLNKKCPIHSLNTFCWDSTIKKCPYCGKRLID